MYEPILVLFWMVGLTYFIFLGDNILGGISTSTQMRTRKKIYEIVRKHAPHAKTFYDLGCSKGTLTLTIKKLLPHLTIYGFDNSKWRIVLAKTKAIILNKPIFFVYQDIFEINVQKADVVFIYLPRELLPRLEKKLLAELSLGAIVITNTGFFPNWKPITTHITHPNKEAYQKLFVYLKS
ncbi:MAG: methyltransferase domain-containing protein [Parcubacteria group bacterium]|nr:methyltransferase domain-containing protein [Parcubacteria group bacterium]